MVTRRLYASPARSSLVVDGLIAVVIAATSIAIALVGPVDGPGRGRAEWSTVAFLVAAALPLAVRRRWPLAVLAVTTTVVLGSSAVAGFDEVGPEALPVMVALYTVGAHGNRRRSLAVGAGMVGILIAAGWFLSGEPQPPLDAFGDLGWVVGSLGIGEAVRNRRAYVAELEERARLALRSRDEEARRRVDEERLRIAREIHDVVAHSIAMISVQAGVAVHVFDTQPEQARAALGEIRKASTQALRELRATLGLLRLPNEADDPRAPTPGLANLERLLAPARGGARIDVETVGTPRDLPASVDLAAYRIVQEALTNVVRHAGPAAVTVSIAYEPDRLAIRVVDDGRGASAAAAAPSDGTRMGLVGMRERAAAVGGEVRAGPRIGGGFEVRATLPTAAPA